MAPRFNSLPVILVLANLYRPGAYGPVFDDWISAPTPNERLTELIKAVEVERIEMHIGYHGGRESEAAKGEQIAALSNALKVEQANAAQMRGKLAAQHEQSRSLEAKLREREREAWANSG